MINFSDAYLSKCIIHKVGNKYLGNSLILSNEEIDLEDNIREQLQTYFSKHFKDNNQSYQFFHHIDLKMNEVYHCVDNIFENESLLKNSQSIARHLYDGINHPSIKPGELFIAIFNDVIINNMVSNAVGIFKSERKDNFLKIIDKEETIGIDVQQGINENKLDKGCFIFNNNYHDGFEVFSYEYQNADSVYWKDEFLKLRVRNDNYNQTSNVLGVYKNFVTEKLDDEFEMSKADKIDLLNRSMKYFKEKDSFDIAEFGQEVIGNEQGIASFLNYKKSYEDEFETPIPDSFDISDAAVKKQSRVYKSVLKLDKNFHIYIHGNKELIEKGFDDGKGMNYYKVFFKEEN